MNGKDNNNNKDNKNFFQDFYNEYNPFNDSFDVHTKHLSRNMKIKTYDSNLSSHKIGTSINSGYSDIKDQSSFGGNDSFQNPFDYESDKEKDNQKADISPKNKKDKGNSKGC